MTYIQNKQDGTVIDTEYPDDWSATDWTRLTIKAGKEAMRQQSINQLRNILKPGDTVYCIVRSVSRSGMSRTIDFYAKGQEVDMRYLSGYMATALGESTTNTGAVKISGCGMDMGFATVYNLGRCLFPDGFGVNGTDAMGRTIWPVTKEKAAKAVERGFLFRGRNGDASGWDNDGGYALKHSYLQGLINGQQPVPAPYHQGAVAAMLPGLNWRVTMVYGDKRDYPKIDIFTKHTHKGKPYFAYATSTTWAKTCKEAKQKFIAAHPWCGYGEADIKVRFAK